MAITGSHNFQVLRGLSSARSLLSCTKDGTVVDLWYEDDDSGRQRWEMQLVPGYDDLYYIMVSRGVDGGRRFLSTTHDGTKVDLWYEDDNSGRQHWQIQQIHDTNIPSYYRIIVSAGVDSGRRFLSCTEDGTKVDLWYDDDNSGRQRWQLQ